MPIRTPPTGEQKCWKLNQCSCCCPGISLYETLEITLFLPTLGITVGPLTLIQTVLEDCPEFPAVGFKCCKCSCRFYGALSTSPCAPVDCGDLPVLDANGKVTEVEMSCENTGHNGGPCNPPPGHGADWRALCEWVVNFYTVNNTCSGSWEPDIPPGFGEGEDPPPTLPVSCDRVFGSLDCTTYECKCPNGFYARFGVPIYCQSGILPGELLDPNGFIEVTGVDPGAPCPDNYDCPEPE